MRDELDSPDASGLRLCNTISLLMPAQTYEISCAWTKEKSLPAVEEFTCRLLLALQEVLPGDVREYFGLSERECHVLLETLERNKLAVYTNDGHLAPSPMLIERTKGNPSASASLTKYEERTETPVFELLTLTIMPSSNYSRSQTGLPEILVPSENKQVSTSTIAEAFGRQYRAFLDYSRMSEPEARKTRLYKVGNCDVGKPVQVPVDLEIWLLPTPAGDVEVLKKTAEKVSDSRKRPLTMELEAKISDYLNTMSVPKAGLSLADYCHSFSDTVLERYVDDRGLDINRWLIDHSLRKTGYGSQLTRSLIGPIYESNNRLTIKGMLDDLSKDWPEGQSHKALWLASSVPLWGASGYLLSEFCIKTAITLSEANSSKGRVTAIFAYEEEREIGQLRHTYKTRIPNAIAFEGHELQDRVEIFLVPGQLAVVQYHFQPSLESAVTVPIGYVTVDTERVALIGSFLTRRLSGRGDPLVAWTEGYEEHLPDLVDSATMETLSASPLALPMSSKVKIIVKKNRKL